MARIVLFLQYAARHVQEMEMMRSGALASSPRLMVLLIGIIAGLASGIAMGLMALAFRKLVMRSVSTERPTVLGQSA